MLKQTKLISLEVDTVPVSQDDFQLQRRLMEKYFRPLHSPQDNRAVRSTKPEMCDHQVNKHGKIVQTKSQQMKHHHPNPGHRHHHSHQDFHHSDDNNSHE